MEKNFELMNTSNNAYEVYNIGDTFHNSNGQDYIILNLNEKEDKAFLAIKISEQEQKIIHAPALYIGVTGLMMHEWAHGHYFMSDFKAACDWFNGVEEPEEKPTTVEDILNFYHANNGNKYVFSNESNYIIFHAVRDIPDYLKHAELKFFTVSGDYNSIDDMEFPHGVITFHITDDIVILENV